MSWGTRQRRLRDLLGAETRKDLVFQVFAKLDVWPIPDDKHRELSDIYGQNADLPEQVIGVSQFDMGYLSDGGNLITHQLLYTSSPYSVSDINRYVEADFHVIANKYREAISAKKLTGIDFISNPYADEGRVAAFCYQVMGCHEAHGDAGVLKPYELIEGEVIKPDTSEVLDFRGHREPYMNITSGQPSEHEMLQRKFNL